MSLLAGLFAPWRGVAFVVRHPATWPRTLLLGLVNLGLGVAGFFVGRALAGALAGPLGLASWPGFLRTAGPIVFEVIVAAAVFVVLQPIVTSPFVDLLTEKVELVAFGRCPTTPLLRSVSRAIVHGALKSVFYGVAVVSSLLLLGTAGPAAVVGWALFALSAAYDAFDYPMARRDAGFVAKWRFLFAHPGLLVGFGAMVVAVAAVPLGLLVVWPFAGVGATLAYVETAREGHHAATPS